jgi:hypothetical protein
VSAFLYHLCKKAVSYSLSSTYAAAVSQEEYAAMQFTKNVPSLTVSKESFPKLFTVLIQNEFVDQDLLNELQQILDQRRGEVAK